MPRSRSCTERHDAAAQSQIADRIVRNDAAGRGDQIHVVLIEPDAMNDVQPLAEQAQFVDVPDQRAAAEVLLPSTRCSLVSSMWM